MATVAEPMTRSTAATPRVRTSDYVELTKPRIAVMALITVGVGYLLGANAETLHVGYLLHTLIGAGLVAAGGSALNHWLERRVDARMGRTLNRPLPAGRLTGPEALSYGITLSVLGVVYLVVALPSPAAAVTAGLTCVLYVAVYTPLKRVTAWNTVVGALPGALPPVIGWTAARGNVDVEALVLFAILFVWQLPHFYSIAWLHREDYARGGMKMLPVVDATNGRATGLATAGTCLLLVVVTAGPALFLTSTALTIYLVGAMPLALWFLARSIRFARHRNHQTARSVLRGSLLYLVGVMGLLVMTGVLPRYLA